MRAESGPGHPFPTLTATEQARFASGRTAFEKSYTLQQGLGPVFNDSSCNRCHNREGVGGGGFQSARLVGRASPEGFDPLRSSGGPMLAQQSVALLTDFSHFLPDCKLPAGGESAPAQANVQASHRTPPLFGLGLVDATPESAFEQLASGQVPAIRGRVARVIDPATGERVAGKFGWKAQSPSLHHFSGQALVMEMGITNPGFPNEEAPLGDARQTARCDAAADPEETEAGVRKLTDFMQMLAPIPPLPPSPATREGDALFSAVGCDGCHVRRLTSGASPIHALSYKPYAPYSDFLLHDMGSLGDRIGGQGDAGPREMRTQPLWGSHLLASRRLLHDGRARSVEQAILFHDGQGAAARDAFASLDPEAQGKLVAFVETL